LSDHLTAVSAHAAKAARTIRAHDTAYVETVRLAGLLHDLGKYRAEFQAYLNAGDRGRRSLETAHAVYGAAASGDRWDSLAAAFAVAAHHAGLHDEPDLATLVAGPKFHALDRYPGLIELADGASELAGAVGSLANADSRSPSAALPQVEFDDADADDRRRFEMSTRIMFSILVDADRLDSEKFEQEHRLGRNWQRSTRTLDPRALLPKLQGARAERETRNADSDAGLNRLRSRVFEACLERGRTLPSGFFTLTVPTGGGKTLSSMAFALAHAERHGLRRVIVVIPYLSIIEQNAREYRTIFGAEQVLEHHSAVELGAGTHRPRNADDEAAQVLDYERAIENWDVPLVVTTSVQFLESLFASAPGRARKLHNIARSVVIFDEVQTLPTHLLEPTLDVLRILQKHFGVSLLFCSATQPAFRRSANLKHGFRQDTGELIEIAPDVTDLFTKLQRVSYRVESVADRWDWKRVAGEMLLRPQALCVVNLRQHAFDLFNALKAELLAEPRRGADEQAVFHLSSAMCPAHRLDVLGLSRTPAPNNIKQRLDHEHPQPCWVVSTQLIEAGVDIDFPVVLRAMGPLDSIVQAAGRCNREGRLKDTDGNSRLGEVIIFHPAESGLPRGIYEKATSITPVYLADAERLASDPDLFAAYFNELYQITPTDRGRRGEPTIQELREKLKFRSVGDAVRVIPDDTTPVIVPYRSATKLIQRIRRARRVDYRVLRRLQRYMVNLRRGPKTLLAQLQDAGRLQPLLPDHDLLVLDAACYDAALGIVFNDRPPEDFVF
jgi:CRISPR-associated endonuclease/helicase Cas3